MAARVWCCVLWSAVTALLFVPAHGAGAAEEVQEPECEKQKRASMDERVTTIDFIDALPKRWRNEAVTINFMHIEFGRFDPAKLEIPPLTYGCKSAELSDVLPAYGGFAWMVLMPNQAGFSLVGPGRVDTSIRSYLEERADRVDRPDDVSGFRVLVSGPFWKLSRRGEIPIGALIRDGVVEEDFRTNFSARYVLCSEVGRGIDLIERCTPTGSTIASYCRQGIDGDEVEVFKSLSDLPCAAAIQVGPALLESSGAHEHVALRTEGRAKLGIGVNSMNRSRRNILISVKETAPNREAAERLVLLSTLFDIASYDAMVASELLVRRLSEEGTLASGGSIVWAVGLVDDESLSGPILTMDGRPTLELSEVDRPTGAIMQFVFDGSER